MAKKINVAVLMGGKSPEHKISLMSGQEIIRNLNPAKYNIFPINVSRDGSNWQISEGFTGTSKQAIPKKNIRQSLSSNLPISLGSRSLLNNVKIDIVFVALHGPNGEDGRVQGFLDLLNLPYTGSKVLASAIAMDKIISRRLIAGVGIKVPKFIVFNKTENSDVIWKNFKSPLIVKPPNQGSSIGVTKVANKKQIKAALKYAFSYSNEILIEEFIEGIEVTGSILGSKNPRPLPLVEIVPKNDFFDYDAKYNESMCDEICPARVSKKIAEKAQETALKAYQTLGCSDFGRVDMIIAGSDVYVLEVNTIPGLTPVSLLPKAAKAAGISYPNLLDKIISYSAP